MGLQRVRHDWAAELNLLWVLCLRASEMGFLGWALKSGRKRRGWEA